jgi:hypothetical protein
MTARSSCAFCKNSNAKMTREHVLPRWLSRAGSAAGSYILKRGSKTIRTSLIEVTTKRVCEDCNTGWMRRIEDGAKMVFEPLLDATAKTITETQRWIIARWFMKTILTAQLSQTSRSGDGILHPQDFETFYNSAQPFQNQFTLISGYQGPLPPIRFEMYAPDETTNRGTRVLFHFHRVVLLAFFMDIGKPSSIHLPQQFQLASHVMWPSQRGLLGSDDPTRPVSWPPPYLLDESAIKNLHEMMASSQPSASTDTVFGDPVPPSSS